MASQPANRGKPNGLDELVRRRYLQAEELQLIVLNGVAYLDGCVASYQQKKALASAVATLPHVRQVVNHLRVTPSSARGDGEIRKNIVAALEKDPIISLDFFSVSVRDGVVELKGQVSSLSGKIAAEALAWSAHGVHHVVNHIEIAPESVQSPGEAGTAIKRSLQSCLGLPVGTFDVQVSKGVAILTGSVATQDQCWAAEDLTRYHPLVHQVLNQLQVRAQGPTSPALSDLPPSA